MEVPRQEEVVQALDLKPHPEGGYYSETYRDDWVMKEESLPEGYLGNRNASTAIHYLLPRGEVSRLHRIRAAEGWHFYFGSPLLLVIFDEENRNVQRIRLGNDVLGGEKVQHVVPSGNPGPWFGVYHPEVPRLDSERDYSLVGCTVAPGFDFRDFELLEGKSRERLEELFPDYMQEIKRLSR